jgi:uncharacterized membrane protein YdjX (TVP38/TMEM64 family)
MNQNKNKYKFLPIIVLLLGIILFFSFGGQNYLSLNALKENYQSLLDYTASHFLLASLIFVLAYVLVVAFSIPGATVMTLLGGFLFGTLFGSILVVLSATFGACLVYFAVTTAFGESLRSKAGGSIEKVRAGLEKDAFNYLLVLRLIPIFPFFVINIAAGVLDIKFKDFFWATLLGIIPGSAIYVWVGTSLGFVLKQGGDINLGIIFAPQFILPIVALALLSLFPIFMKKFKKKVQKAEL